MSVGDVGGLVAMVPANRVTGPLPALVQRCKVPVTMFWGPGLKSCSCSHSQSPQPPSQSICSCQKVPYAYGSAPRAEAGQQPLIAALEGSACFAGCWQEARGPLWVLAREQASNTGASQHPQHIGPSSQQQGATLLRHPESQK